MARVCVGIGLAFLFGGLFCTVRPFDRSTVTQESNGDPRPGFWHVSWQRAREEAQASNKPILIFGSPGAVNSSTCVAGNIFRRDTLWSGDVQKILARDFVLLTHDHRTNSSVPLAPETKADVVPLAYCPPVTSPTRLCDGEGTGNIWCCVADCNGEIIEVVPGYCSPSRFVRILQSAVNRSRQNQVQRHSECAANTVEPYLYGVRRFADQTSTQ